MPCASSSQGYPDLVSTGDVCSDFARGVVAVERGEQPSLKVGNLETVRDLLDVEDAVRVLWLLAQKGTPGEAYNVCPGVGYKIQAVLEGFLILASKPVHVEHDPMRLRPVDPPAVIGDNARLRALGWASQVALDHSLARVLDYWRSLS
jgi:GDP-4-dehydro-6-deoxy-D-mannose reductase